MSPQPATAPRRPRQKATVSRTANDTDEHARARAHRGSATRRFALAGEQPEFDPELFAYPMGRRIRICRIHRMPPAGCQYDQGRRDDRGRQLSDGTFKRSARRRPQTQRWLSTRETTPTCSRSPHHRTNTPNDPVTKTNATVRESPTRPWNSGRNFRRLETVNAADWQTAARTDRCDY